ncbi:UNVERIFIED_CONTAM: hypothetical protein FKN15_047468 [Acipenser sinensis]
MSSSHPNNCSVPEDNTQAGSTGQKNCGGGLQTCPPFFMVGSSPPWGSGHPFSCSEIAAGWSWSPDLPPFFVADSCPSWGSSHSISCRMAGLVATPVKTGPSGGDGSSCSPPMAVEAEPAGIHPLLVELGAVSSPPMTLETEPAGIHPLLVEVAEAEAALAALLLVGEAEGAGILPLLLEAWALDARAPPLWAMDAQASPLWALDAWAPPLWALDARAPPFWALDARAPPFWALDARAPPFWALGAGAHTL